MARCNICLKGTTVGRRISINRSQVSKRAKRKFKANVQKKRVVLENGEVRRLNMCTRCIRSAKETV